MKKKFQSIISQIRLGQVLLPASLLVVTLSGFLHLYEIQTLFFPESYYAAKLKLIRNELYLIDKAFKSSQSEMVKLETARNVINYSSRSSAITFAAQPSGGRQPVSEPSWLETLKAAKKNRVYVARKLRYLEAILPSMQHTLESRKLPPSGLALFKSKTESDKILGEVREFQDRCQIYNSKLSKLTEELNQLGAQGIYYHTN